MLNTGTNAITNEANATLEAKVGGVLEIDSNVTNVDPLTSIIRADDGGTVELVNDTITGGTIALASTGTAPATALQIEGTVTLSASHHDDAERFRPERHLRYQPTNLRAPPSWSITATSAAPAASATALPI